MGKIFIINDSSITAGVASTSDIGLAPLAWRHGYFSGTVTVGTSSVTGAVIANNGVFTTTVTAATASFSGNLFTVGTTSIGALIFADNRTITFGTGTGTTIGTGTNQKLAFYNVTAVVQASVTGETVGFTAVGGTGVNDQSTFTGNVGSTAYRISDVVKALKNLGLIKQ